MTKKCKRTAIGLVTGFANGLFGSGGGTIVVPAMERFLGEEEHKAHATAIAVILPLSLLSLDEPFSALDYLTRVEMQEWLLEQWEHYHKTILFITHDVEEAVFLSKKIFVIQDRPFSSMEMVEVPLPAHRDRNDLKKPEIVDLKERLIGKLRRSVRL